MRMTAHTVQRLNVALLDRSTWKSEVPSGRELELEAAAEARKHLGLLNTRISWLREGSSRVVQPHLHLESEERK